MNKIDENILESIDDVVYSISNLGVKDCAVYITADKTLYSKILKLTEAVPINDKSGISFFGEVNEENNRLLIRRGNVSFIFNKHKDE